MKAAALTRITLGLAAIFATGAAWAQAGKGPAQVVKPPVSQAWIVWAVAPWACARLRP
mgnify:CR=1 FL=1